MLPLMKCPYLLLSTNWLYMVGLPLSIALITYSIVEEFEEYMYSYDQFYARCNCDIPSKTK